MKNIKNYIGIIVFVLAVSTAYSQTPPPNNGTTSSGGTTPVGGGAPVEGGLLILISIATAYAYMQYRKRPANTV